MISYLLMMQVLGHIDAIEGPQPTSALTRNLTNMSEEEQFALALKLSMEADAPLVPSYSITIDPLCMSQHPRLVNNVVRIQATDMDDTKL